MQAQEQNSPVQSTRPPQSGCTKQSSWTKCLGLQRGIDSPEISEIPMIFPYMFVGCNSILLTVFPQFLLVKSPVFTYLLWVFPTQSHPSQLPGFADGFAESPSHQFRLRRRSSSLPRIKAAPNLKPLGQPGSAIWLLRFYRFVGGISWD